MKSVRRNSRDSAKRRAAWLPSWPGAPRRCRRGTAAYWPTCLVSSHVGVWEVGDGDGRVSGKAGFGRVSASGEDRGDVFLLLGKALSTARANAEKRGTSKISRFIGPHVAGGAGFGRWVWGLGVSGPHVSCAGRMAWTSEWGWGWGGVFGGWLVVLQTGTD